ncbi:Fas-binding factor 1-like [Homarus americanus]|uniref:Fas-binding factor 1-like n=1 Tax=Homarus americanus TaxID=6706 RepID=A0A8J5JPN9_HOMAM|nr:Fas-binding factor 1-like [Homarus americanus]
MSDLEISGSDSEPVSDVNPEEMARLMADIDELDNDLFKSTSKSSGKSGSGSTIAKSQDTKDPKRRVTFNEKPGTPAKASEDDDDDDDDWDADDLLHSDDEVKPRGKLAKKPETSDASSVSPAKAAASDKDNKEDSGKKTMAKSKLMADLFSDNSQDLPKERETKSPTSSESKKDKSKLMADLFGGGDDSSNPGNSRENKDSGETATKRGTARKAKENITFDDDDDLFGGLEESRKKPVSDSPKGGSFLDSLLTKSNASEQSKVKRETNTEFNLDERYKNIGKETKGKSTKDFGGYMPSSSKPNSPSRGTPKKTTSDDTFDLFGDFEPRKRNPRSRSAPQKKTYEIDDDDILGNIRSRKGVLKDSDKESPHTKPSPSGKSSESPKVKKKSPAKAQNKDDWLFGDASSVSDTMKKNIDETSIDQADEGIKQSSPSKNEDWLGKMLGGNTKSPSISKQAASQGSSPSVQHPGGVPEGVSVSASPVAHTVTAGVVASRHQNIQSLSDPVTNSAILTSTLPAATPFIPAALPTVPSVPSVMTAVLQTPEDLKQQFLKQQQEAQAQAAAVAAQLKQHQNQLEMQMAQQLQQQQQNMAEVMKRQQEAALERYKGAVSAVGQYDINASVPVNNSDQQKDKVDLKTAKVEVAGLKAELDLIRKQHTEEVAVLEEGHRRKLDVEKEIWDRVEKRLREERDSLLSDFQKKISLVQVIFIYKTYFGIKSEWSQAVERTKELYSGMVERMKEEHQATLERMTQLKEMELKAALSATGHVREVEAVMTQLESNTSNLSELTASINIRHDSSLELTQRALKMKEKQLQEFEAQLATSRAESEGERNRLNTLIQRLENTLMQQGSEVEKERWRLAQERMKMEMERQAMTEERKHLRISTETERQNLASARESLMSEHRSLLQSLNRQKQELASQQANLGIQQNLGHVSALGTHISAGNMNHFDAVAEMPALNEERRRLREKIAAVNIQEQQLQEEETKLEQLKLQVEQEKAKLKLEREVCAQEQLLLTKTRKETEAARQEVDLLRQEQEARLNQITTQTRALHKHQEKLENVITLPMDHVKLEQLREEVVRLSQYGLCASCRTKGAANFVLEYVTKPYNGRLPGDGGEGYINNSFKVDLSNKANLSPASVLARLAAARERENTEREKRLLQMSVMESS